MSWPNQNIYGGIHFVRSTIKLRNITDGTSKTYLLGEKYLNPHRYEDGGDVSDDWSMYSGHQGDVARTGHASWPPAADTKGFGNSMSFGSAHPGAWNVSYCDGSVRGMSYEIDSETHRRLAVRNDGLQIESSQ
jgi:prepilin-type processing-associated H-X9-DG protein